MTESSEGARKGLSKRRFLKAAGAAALGVGILAAGYESLKYSEVRIDFSTPDADYFFLGGSHGNQDLGKLDVITSLRESDVPDDTTVFEIETGTFPYLGLQTLPMLGKLYTYVRNIDFWQEPVRLLTDKKLPLVLTDIPSTSVNPESITTIMGAFAPSLGLALMRVKEKSLTRRKFMLGGAFSFLGLGSARLYSGEILGFLQRSLSEPWAQKAAKLHHWIELSKPEDLVTTFRNSINSAKTLGLEPRFPINPQTHRAKMLMIYGSGHLVLPEYMKGGKQVILDYLSLYPKTFIDKTFGLDNPHLYTSAILTPEQNGNIKVKTIEDKDLKAIFE